MHIDSSGEQDGEDGDDVPEEIESDDDFDQSEFSAEHEYYLEREGFDQLIESALTGTTSPLNSTWRGMQGDRLYSHARRALRLLTVRGKQLRDVPTIVREWGLHTSVYPFLERNLEYREHTAEVTLVAAAAHVLLQYRLMLVSLRAIWHVNEGEARSRRRLEMRARYAVIERHAGTMERAALFLAMRGRGAPAAVTAQPVPPAADERSRAGLRLGSLANAWAAAIKEDKIRDAIKHHILTHPNAMREGADGTRKLAWDADDCADYLYNLQVECGIVDKRGGPAYALTTLIERLSPLIQPYR